MNNREFADIGWTAVMDPRCRLRRPGHAASSLLLLLLLAADGARCEGQNLRLVRKLLPPEYEARLQVLKLALALDEEWSAVWSEKLKPRPVAAKHPDKEFCTCLIPAVTGEGEDETPIDTYVTVRQIVDQCAFSGLYVEFGMKLISSSIRCLFIRFARVNLSAVTAMVEAGDDQYHEYLRQLVVGYEEIADKLAAVGESLHDLVQLVAFFDDVTKQSIKLTKEGNREKLTAFYTEVRSISNKIMERLNEEFIKSCAVSKTEWYDKENKESVSLAVLDDNNSSTSVASIDQNNMIQRANKLRTLMRTMFERLRIREMTPEMWKEIFTMNILMTPDDMKVVATANQEEEEELDVNL